MDINRRISENKNRVNHEFRSQLTFLRCQRPWKE